MTRLSRLLWPTHAACVLMALQATGCGELPNIPDNTCGNAIVEPGEECDTYAPAGTVCRPPSASEGGCRFDCTPTADGAKGCPKEAGVPLACGTDYICRSSTGTFEPFGRFLSVPAQSLELGDFDGDGRDDLVALGATNVLWQAYPRILFFDQFGEAQGSFDPRIPISSPIALTLEPANAQSRQPKQIVFSSMFGIGAAEVTPGRAVLPIAYPIQVLPRGWSYRVLRLRGPAEKPAREAVLLFMSDSGPASTTPGIIAEASSVSELSRLPKGVQYLAGPPIAANVVDLPHSPCEEAVFTFRDDEHVYLFEPCDATGRLAAPREPQAVVAVAGGRAIGQPPIAAHVDRDRHLDLLLGDASDPSMPYVAFGNGDGTFLADPENPQSGAIAWPVQVERGECPNRYEIDPSFPLAVGDLNGDGLSDWVTHKGVQLTQSISVDPVAHKVHITACTTHIPFMRQWTKATIADINGDGLLDVIAGSDSEPDLDLLRGTGLDFLNPSAIATGGSLNHLSTGDFDGDGITDIVFDAMQTTVPVHDRLSIAFGRVAQPPEAPIEIGDFVAIDQLETGKYAGDDAMDEIGVIATPSDSPGQQLSVFIGSAGRHPIAPMGLQAPVNENGDMIEGVPLALAAGRVGDDLHPSLIAVSRYCDNVFCENRLWWVPSSSHGRFGMPVPSAPVPSEFVPFHADEVEMAVQLLVGDVDSDGSGDALALTSDLTGTRIGLWRLTLPAPGTNWQESSPAELLSSTPGRLTPATGAKLVDLDDDGKHDLILIVEDEGGEQRLGVVRNRGNFLDLSQIEYVELPDQPRGFAVGGDARRLRIMVVTDVGTHAVAVVRASTGSDSTFSASPIAGLPGGTSIAVGNIAGYGLADLAIGSSAGLQLFSEVPTRR